MTTLDEQFEKWWKTWAPLDCGKDHAKAAYFACAEALLNREPSENMVTKGAHVNSELLDAEAPLHEYRYARLAKDVYRAMRAVEREELGMKSEGKYTDWADKANWGD